MSDFTRRTKKWLIRFITPPRTLKITKVGWYFIALTFAVGFAAVNSGNNLLYIILGAMLSFIVASGVMSNIALRDLVITREISDRAFAKTPTLYRFGVKNKKRFFPSYLILLKDEAPFMTGGFLTYLGPKGEEFPVVEALFPKRGPFALGNVAVSTSFPFGLFTKGMKRSIDEEILVLPRIREVDPEGFDLRGWEGEVVVSKSGHGGEPWGVTEYFPGDNPRHIHWRSTAKRGDIMRKEFAEESERKITIRLIVSDSNSEDEIEYKIEAAASVAVRFIRGDYAVGLIIGSEFLKPAKGMGQLEKILEALALFSPGRVTAAPPVIDEADTGAIIDV
ncbi:MAG: DUF58 domain-containing protein [Deltaproteobacteria bacterium]|uniref:DUF58 domain-containing protein n=1 Tax=Candidatus Zymogenus saltonus TaxID=2844893 RepID=A0A9D8KED3_9DELT|nr:DUF58 domain-containing protein [Candidatus Zymogenus saltonus]